MRWPRKRRQATDGDAEAAAREALEAKGASMHELSQIREQADRVHEVGARMDRELKMNTFGPTIHRAMQRRQRG